jgi:adenosylmethionine-8-amino-7-oxononanoate aminotransferase
MSDLKEKDKNFVWHPFTPLVGSDEPIMISAAEGIYLKTADGRKIIDGISSWWVNLHGHSNPVIAKAIAEQANTLEHVIFAGFTHEPAVTLAENLLSILPSNQKKIFYSDNGSTAVEVGLKMAMQYWFNKGITNRKNVIAIKGAYHGDTFGSMSVGDRSIFTDPFSPYLFEVKFIDFPDSESSQKVIDQFKELIDNNNVGAFIFEPLVQAAGGMRMYTPEVLDELITLAHAKDIICIADEVFTGFGRTGKLFASHHLKNSPDIMALSKGLTGGTMPLGVTSCSEKIVSAFNSDEFLKTFFHGHSFTANPLACAVANASFKILLDKKCQDNIQRVALQHEAFKVKVKSHPRVLHARSLGTIFAIEIKNDERTSYENSVRKKIYQFFIDHDILLRPLGNVVYIVPPYIISNDELNKIYLTIEKFLDEL